MLGQSSVLTCVVYTSLPVSTNLLSAQWMHEGGPITADDEFILNSSLIYVTRLNLKKTTVEQSGLYSCYVSLDTNRQRVTAEGNLTVSCK